MKSADLLWIFVLVLALGCSSQSSDNLSLSPLAPTMANDAGDTLTGTQLWDLYDITLDPAAHTAEIVPLRTPQLQLNVLKFLQESGAGNNILLTNLTFSLPEVTVTIGYKHPFAGFPQFTGFSVRGILLTNGTMGGFSDPSLVMSGPDQLRMLNSDGYTRWLNPSEFPYNGSLLNYYPWEKGSLSGGTFTSTINPYKYYADGLDAVTDDLNLNEALKGAFLSGALIERKWELNFGTQPLLSFQMAVVASREVPLSIPPQIPDDFPIGTVADEPWKIEVNELSKTLYYLGGVQGGSLDLQITVSDFENAHLDKVYIESGSILPRTEVPYVSQDGIHVTYEISLDDELNLTSEQPFELFITAVAPDGFGYDGRLPGEECAMYAFYTVEVLLEPQVLDCPGFPFMDDFESYNCVWSILETNLGNPAWYPGFYWDIAERLSSDGITMTGVMDATGGGTYGNDAKYATEEYPPGGSSNDPNPEISIIASPTIHVPVPGPTDPQNLKLSFDHTIDVDPIIGFGNFAWDQCYIRINGVKVSPTAGPAYENNYIPWTFTPIQCWTGFYDWTTSEFNLGTAYNGYDIQIEFVLDTYDFYLNSDPPYFGWYIDNILVEHVL